MHASRSNFGAYCRALLAAIPTALTAASTGDNTKITGETIDRLGYGSGKLIVPYKAVLTEDKTLSLAIEIQDSADGSTWNTAVVLQSSTAVSTGGSGGSTNKDVSTLDVDLSAYDRYVRFNVTPDLNASSTDTAIVAASFVKGGASVLSAA